VDKKARFDKYGKIQETLVELAPTIWLGDQAMQWAYQSYLTWLIAERAKSKQPLSPVMGYSHYVRDMRLDLNKRAELLK